MLPCRALSYDTSPRLVGRFAEELDKVRNALPKKHGTKIYDKVIGKIGRLKERYKRVSRHYEITVTKDENTNRATAITWEHKEQEKPVGVYCLRSNRVVGGALEEPKAAEVSRCILEIG
ncbi:MAG: hypothetical protein ABFD45_10020 [Smithella sp.]